jgi:hypothetical protein
MPRWADLFAPRQLLAAGVMVEELRKLRPEIVEQEGEEMADAIEHLLAIALDKFINYNSHLSSWHAPRVVMRSVFDRHDFAFKPTFAEMALCGEEGGMPYPCQKGKPAVIVTACSAPWPLSFIAAESRGAIRAVNHILHYGGYRILGKIVKPGTKSTPQISKRLLKNPELSAANSKSYLRFC